MIIIKTINIFRFRSIIKLKLDLSDELNLIAICGENNVGKTNTLRAINLFFNPHDYDVALDRPTLKKAQGGGSIDPKIAIEFYDTSTDKYFYISREIKSFEEETDGLSGETYKKAGTHKKDKEILDKSKIKQFLNKIQFRYIESINIDIPKLVEDLTSDVIDVEYDKSRFTANRKNLKDAYDAYTSGLNDILGNFANDISSTFNNFRENWNISLKIPTASDTFKDLVSKDVELFIDDKGCIKLNKKVPVFSD